MQCLTCNTFPDGRRLGLLAYANQQFPLLHLQLSSFSKQCCAKLLSCHNSRDYTHRLLANHALSVLPLAACLPVSHRSSQHIPGNLTDHIHRDHMPPLYNTITMYNTVLIYLHWLLSRIIWRRGISYRNREGQVTYIVFHPS